MNPQEKKFRAWDGHKMYYATLDALIFSMGSQGAGDWTLVEQVGEELAGFAGQLPAQRDCTMVYMEYTGMKDKADKDIYESDRVRGEYGEGWIVYDATKGAWRVQMYTGWHALDACELEVIGHLYEPTAPPESEAHDDQTG